MTFTTSTIIGSSPEPNSQIELNTTLSIEVQGASIPLAVIDPQNRPGWYYNSTLQTDGFVWTIFNGINQDFTLGNVQNLIFTATHDNTPTNKCYIAITTPFSRIVFENNNVELIPGEKCLFYTDIIPSNSNQLRLVQLNLVTKIGPCSPLEPLMSITLEGTNATLYPDTLQVCVENIGYQLNPDQVPVLVNLSAEKPINVTITGFATEATLSNLNGKIHNDTTHFNAIQVEVKNTTSIPVSNDSLALLTFSGTSLYVDVTNTVPISNLSLASLTFSGTSLNVDVTNTVPISNLSLASLTFSGTSLNVDVTNTVPVSNDSLALLTFSGTSLNVDVTNTVPISNDSLALLTFSGTSLNVDVTNTVPVSNSALSSLTFSGNALVVGIQNTSPIPVTNASLSSLTFSGNSLNVDVTNTVPVSNSALSSLTFSGNALVVGIQNTSPIPVTNSSLSSLTFSGTSLNVDVTNTVPISNSSLSSLTFSGTSLNVAVSGNVNIKDSAGNSLSAVSNNIPQLKTTLYDTSGANITSDTFSFNNLTKTGIDTVVVNDVAHPVNVNIASNSFTYIGGLYNVLNNVLIGAGGYNPSPAFDCSLYGVNSVISYSDSNTNTTNYRVFLYAINQPPGTISFGNCYCIGVLDPIYYPSLSKRIATATVNLAPFKSFYIYSPEGQINNVYVSLGY